jgi:hypothetical protein
VALVALALVELSLGGIAFVALSFTQLGLIAGSMPLAWGVLTPLTLLLLAGTGIFVRRPWTYLLHCLVTPVALVGASVALAFEVGPIRGTPVVALTAVAAGVLQLFFLTTDVHRWFDDFWGE